MGWLHGPLPLRQRLCSLGLALTTLVQGLASCVPRGQLRLLLALCACGAAACACRPSRPFLVYAPRQVVEASDVIIEVLDARDPLGCRCADVERFIRKTDPSKKIVVLLNKIGGWGGAGGGGDLGQGVRCCSAVGSMNGMGWDGPRGDADVSMPPCTFP